MAKQKNKAMPLSLTTVQITHLIYGAIRNLIELRTDVVNGKTKFFFILECISPEICIPPNIEPESEDEFMEIAFAHCVPELYDFFDAILAVKTDGGEFFRAFSTIDIDHTNVAQFIKRLSELDEYWTKIDDDIEREEDVEGKTKGKNVVQGNSTLN